MSKTITVPDDCYAWLMAHNEDGETEFETLRRLTREPRPEALAGILSTDAVENARTAAERFGGRDDERLTRAGESFDEWVWIHPAERDAENRRAALTLSSAGHR